MTTNTFHPFCRYPTRVLFSPLFNGNFLTVLLAPMSSLLDASLQCPLLKPMPHVLGFRFGTTHFWILILYCSLHNEPPSNLVASNSNTAWHAVWVLLGENSLSPLHMVSFCGWLGLPHNMVSCGCLASYIAAGSPPPPRKWKAGAARSS